MSQQRRVEVAVRVRPDPNAHAASCVALHAAARHVVVQDEADMGAAARRRSYRCDFLFDEHVRNRAVFEELVLERMRSAVPESPDTFCFLAYGHTNSGKTFSIAGSDEEPGILALCVAELLRRDGMVEVSMLEVYQDCVNDLLAQGEPRCIRRRQAPQGPVIVVEGLTTSTLTTSEQWSAISAYGMRSRRTAPTERNMRSSRSHAIFTIKSAGVRLCLVDLAGSERQKVFSPQLNKESISINTSLSRLSTVLEALSRQRVDENGGRTYVNFRDTTLTVLLQRYLAGSSMTTFLACVHPSADFFQETLSTLRYTQRLKRIRTRMAGADVPEWSSMKSDERQNLLWELKRLRELVGLNERETKRMEEVHEQRIGALQRMLALQGVTDGGGTITTALHTAPSAPALATHARDARRTAAWLLSRMLGSMPHLNVGYDTYFDAFFPSTVQVVGYVSTMAGLVARTAQDPPMAFLDVGDMTMGLSMLDAGVPPFVRLHRAGCADPASWEEVEWDGAPSMVYAFAFFEHHPAAMTLLSEAAEGEEALPCCGGVVTSAPLLPIATVLCVAAACPSEVKEEVLQRLVDLQGEQCELADAPAKTLSDSLSLNLSVSSLQEDGGPVQQGRCRATEHNCSTAQDSEVKRDMLHLGEERSQRGCVSPVAVLITEDTDEAEAPAEERRTTTTIAAEANEGDPARKSERPSTVQRRLLDDCGDAVERTGLSILLVAADTEKLAPIAAVGQDAADDRSAHETSSSATSFPKPPIRKHPSPPAVGHIERHGEPSRPPPHPPKTNALPFPRRRRAKDEDTKAVKLQSCQGCAAV